MKLESRNHELGLRIPTGSLLSPSFVEDNISISVVEDEDSSHVTGGPHARVIDHQPMICQSPDNHKAPYSAP